MSHKKISVIVPCYNQVKYLNECLISVLNQTYSDWECIIVNDGSQDHTEKVALEWLEKDIRFRYLFQENQGLCSARNLGISNAVGEFILPLDADDKISSTYLANAIIEFENDSSLKLVYCLAEKFGEESGLWQLPDFNLYNLSQNNLIFCSAVYKKKDWELIGGYDSKMIYGWEDWEFWIAMLKNGGNVKRIEEVGFYYRIKSKSMLDSINYKNANYLSNYLSIKHADFFVKHYGSFKKMKQEVIQITNEYEYKLTSEKFAIDVFCSVFFGFSIFGKYRKPKNN
ncbi:glycosyltransferase family A protein [Flavobacterium turcicum]|jgi:glycosyltransferase involved in cell wall biosynthesis|uniref:Glycosyltransferase family 2 protein n=1 Tax=Flavobacterium turcicum TaxID=2764718 RepID=A0ABR7JHB7_9FLAO|nr:glycosyltransferase family A protein [Flavobacterium turcicum]MBC5863651.1 glycosyltransferase family 2 protein [Flavobacterium turcicum]NHL02399.1 glycosyltransferase family 2 protein [Flavobacterium turcicum]